MGFHNEHHDFPNVPWNHLPTLTKLAPDHYRSLKSYRSWTAVLLNFIFNRTTSPGILANLIAPNGFKVGSGPERYEFYFNRLLKLPRFEQHMADTLMLFVEKVFGINVPEGDRRFEIEVPSDSMVRVDVFLKAHGLRRRSLANEGLSAYILVNLSVKDRQRRFSHEQAASMVTYLTGKGGAGIVLLIAPGDDDMERIVNVLPELKGLPVFKSIGDRPLMQLASLVEGALFVVTMDTSLVHFASAMQTPVVAFYTELVLWREWHPYGVPHGVLLTPAGQSISGIPIESMIQKTEEFITSTFPGGLPARSRSV